MPGAPRSGWTGTAFVTTIGAMILAILAFAMSGYRDARISQDGTRPVVSRSIVPDGGGNR